MGNQSSALRVSVTGRKEHLPHLSPLEVRQRVTEGVDSCGLPTGATCAVFTNASRTLERKQEGTFLWLPELPPSFHSGTTECSSLGCICCHSPLFSVQVNNGDTLTHWQLGMVVRASEVEVFLRHVPFPCYYDRPVRGSWGCRYSLKVSGEALTQPCSTVVDTAFVGEMKGPGAIAHLSGELSKVDLGQIQVHLEVDRVEYLSCGVPTIPSLPSQCHAIQLLSRSPRVLVVDNFLSPSLCEALMELAGPRLIRSRVASGTETPSRTSWSYFFTGDNARHPLITTTEARISALMQHPAVAAGCKPLAHCEALQVVKYHTGEFYKEHFDNKAGGNLTRAATIIVYLCDTREGGATFFPKAAPLCSPEFLTPQGSEVLRDEDDERAPSSPMSLGSSSEGVIEKGTRAPDKTPPSRSGLRVFPVTGRALVFWSKLPDGNEDFASIHSAEVVTAGEKWIATRWFQEVEG